MKQHPVTFENDTRIDIYFGQRQAHVAEDVMTLVHQSLPAMQKGESILIINTLCNHDDLAKSMDMISGMKGDDAKDGGQKDRARAIVYSAAGRVLREKLDFLAALISAKQVKMLILNSWEFATLGSRQKHALACWLRQMRDAFRLRVVVYSCERERPKFGALANLSFAASSTASVGAWHHEKHYIEECHQPTASEASMIYAAKVRAAEERIAKSEKPSMTMPRRKWQGVLGAGELVSGSLKNKELSGVRVLIYLAHPCLLANLGALEASKL